MKSFFVSAFISLYAAFPLFSYADTPSPSFIDQMLNGSSPHIRAELLKHPKLLREGTLYLTTCQFETSADAKSGCYYNRIKFLVEYVDAFYNHITAQENVAFDLAGDGGTAMPDPGVDTNHVQGCAWRIAILASGGPSVGASDAADAKDDCSRISDALRHAAEARAATIVQDIHKHLTDGSTPIETDDAYK